MFWSLTQFNRFTWSYYCKLEIIIASLSDRKHFLLTHELLKSPLIYLGEVFFCLKYLTATHLRHLFNAIMMHRCVLSRQKQSFKFSMQFALAPKKRVVIYEKLCKSLRCFQMMLIGRLTEILGMNFEILLYRLCPV